MDDTTNHYSVVQQLGYNYSTVTLLVTTAVLAVSYAARKALKQNDKSQPPVIPHTLPFLGHAISFGKSPVEFLVLAYQKYGPVFSFQMMGKTFTYLIGSDAAATFFNGKNEDLNAEEVYGKLVTPVFGKGVAYDVPNSVFLEQKKMFKIGLNIARFKTHIPMIEEETREYFLRWGQQGQNDLFKALSECIILTASRCLHGKEIRSVLNEEIAQLYMDLDGGFSPEAWLLPSWLPLPSFKRRDDAHRKIKQIFHEAIRKRKESGERGDDVLQTLLDTPYKSGRYMTDDEISGMLIGLLMAGQHTSSSTGSWMGFFIAQDKNIQERLYEEQIQVFGEELRPVDYEGLKECTFLENCVKETLRLRPPLMTMMRMCKTPVQCCGYTIPVGHQVCVSPSTNHQLPDVWHNYDKFMPERFEEKSPVISEDKFSYIPFGVGRHRCIGESFAYIQLKTIWSILVRSFEFELVDGKFPPINLAYMIHTPNDPVIKFKRRTQNL